MRMWNNRVENFRCLWRCVSIGIRFTLDGKGAQSNISHTEMSEVWRTSLSVVKIYTGEMEHLQLIL